MLGRVTAVQEVHNNLMHVDRLTLSSCNIAFAFSLYKHLYCLGLPALGAKNNTLEEILQGLKFNLIETPKPDVHQGFGQLLQQLNQPEYQVQISTGSTMFIEKHLQIQIRAEFKEKARTLYQAETFTANFQKPHETKKLTNDCEETEPGEGQGNGLTPREADIHCPGMIDELHLPKFSISTDYSLEDIIPQLGIRDVFSTQADLSAITGATNLRVSQVVHKAVLDLAETGRRTVKMAFIAALWILMAGICPAVLCSSEGTLGNHTAIHQDTRKQLDSKKLASMNTDFAFNLYKKLSSKYPHDNIVFSPLSITMGLASLSLGAKGKTLGEILEGLELNVTETPEADIHQSFSHLLHILSQPEDQVQISTGSAMFIEKHLQILTEFKEEARALYQTEVFTADFQQPCEARKLINDHVSNQTQGKIKGLVSDLDVKTSMLMADFVVFQGKWDMAFELDQNRRRFYADMEMIVMVLMMEMEDVRVPYFRDQELKCTVVELNYKGNNKVMFILPDQGRIMQVEASLQPSTLRKWRKSLRLRMIDELYLPKFSISKMYSLENILPELGIKEVFSTEADLSGITGTKDLRVSQMVHNTVLDMTEMGTEAEASTRDKDDFLSAKINPTVVNINMPFLFWVINPDSEIISFMGRVANPEQD
ncbi:Serine (or cysteine) peptidase inhibitor, clade A (alpha-1 antiproteinase, antitrypsin), member 3J [Apodemus speciosus]|uniref:Serine (Or cysteine) peptidase inhibitor, clade A (Alpha-1 antiproteinase, antitrypsin), member 3J n=1 Tax=Apodemus speciosus TaxID=105296 RepID=A0ABQ0FEU7_APOSI